MADNYSEATVNTNIPARLVSDVEKELLQALGYECEPADSGGSNLYFFQQESGCYLHIANPGQFLLQLKTTYPGKSRPDWTIRLIEVLQNVAGNEEELTEIDLDELVIEAEQLFQSILNKPRNSGPDAIDEIVIMGAYHCSRMRPDQFGGWVTRITRNRIESESTISLLERLRKGEAADKHELLYATASALSRLHDLFSKIVEDGRVNWASESEHESVLAAFGTSNTALARTY